jgi:hypothetical protein
VAYVRENDGDVVFCLVLHVSGRGSEREVLCRVVVCYKRLENKGGRWCSGRIAFLYMAVYC